MIHWVAAYIFGVIACLYIVLNTILRGELREARAEIARAQDEAWSLQKQLAAGARRFTASRGQDYRRN